MRVNVLERGSGSIRNMTNLLIGLEDHKLPWWCCSACEVRAPLPINIVDATYSHCSLLISLSNFRGWFWVPLFPRVQLRYQVCHLLSLESVETSGALVMWLRDSAFRGCSPVRWSLSNCINLKCPYVLLWSSFS